MIMPGIKVGHGAVIGSRALITKDVAPYTIVGGNPAKPIKLRFPESDIAMLLEMQWWDWPLERIEDAMPLLCSANIADLYQYWQEFCG
jgi:chloramphenicol O-acetyltransferase type B